MPLVAIRRAEETRTEKKSKNEDNKKNGAGFSWETRVPFTPSLRSNDN